MWRTTIPLCTATAATALEPWLSEQWFVAVDKLKGPATEAVNSGKVTFHPCALDADVYHLDGEPQGLVHQPRLWVGSSYPRVPLRGLRLGRRAYGGHRRVPQVRRPSRAQEENVLDTWFVAAVDVRHAGLAAKSGAARGPSSDDCARYRTRHHRAVGAPHGHESAYFLEEMPFKDVVIYATILAKDGSRMSKSKATALAPMDLICMYGATRCAYNLLTLVTNNQDVSLTRTSTRRPTSSSAARARSQASACDEDLERESFRL